MCLFVRQLWQTLQTLYINIANIFDLFFFFCVFFSWDLPYPPFHISLFYSLSQSCHISEKLAAQAWNWCDEKQLGYLYEPFALLLWPHSLPSVCSSTFCCNWGACNKLASSYLRLPAKCIIDPTPAKLTPHETIVVPGFCPNFVSVILRLFFFFLLLDCYV